MIIIVTNLAEGKKGRIWRAKLLNLFIARLNLNFLSVQPSGLWETVLVLWEQLLFETRCGYNVGDFTYSWCHEV